MKLEYLQEFLALVQSKNYADAAESLYLSTSTLSRHIMALEKELGAVLFHRDPKGVRLTKSGERLLPYARRLTETAGEMRAALSEGRENIPLSIGFIDALRQYGFLDSLFRFQQENPDLSLVFTENNSTTLWKMVLKRECGFAFCYEYESFRDGSLAVLPLLRDTLAVALPAGHPLSRYERLTPPMLKNEQFIFPNRGSNTWRTYVRLLQQAHLEPREPLFAGNSTLPMVANGLGCTLLEKKRHGSRLPDNVVLLDLEPAVEKRLSLFYREHPLTPAEQRFLDFVRESFPGCGQQAAL